MDQKHLFKQIIDFQKATFDNSFNALATLQEQGETMISTSLNQAEWLPEEGKKVIKEWLDTYKKARTEFKNTVDGNFKKVQEFFDSTKTDA
jgi:polyhydroxyalkanoate synthesis regulator phasin